MKYFSSFFFFILPHINTVHVHEFLEIPGYFGSSIFFLLPRATDVPVGDDQVKHVELARHLANLFNRKYGFFFPKPKVITGKLKLHRNKANTLLWLFDPWFIVGSPSTTLVQHFTDTCLIYHVCRKPLKFIFIWYMRKDYIKLIVIKLHSYCKNTTLQLPLSFIVLLFSIFHSFKAGIANIISTFKWLKNVFLYKKLFNKLSIYHQQFYQFDI